LIKRIFKKDKNKKDDNMCKIKKNQRLKNITPFFTSLLEQLGERTCKCENAKVIMKDHYDCCSICGKHHFYKNSDCSFIGLVIGMKTSGKTIFTFSVIDKILEYDPQRKLAIWSDIDISEYKSIYSDRFYKVNNFFDVGFNDILLLDHLNFDLHSNEDRFYMKLERFMSYMRMKRIILFVSLPDVPIPKELLEMADLICFKRLTKYFIEQSRFFNDEYIKNDIRHYSKKLLSLKKNETVIIIDSIICLINIVRKREIGIVYNNLNKNIWNKFLIKIKRCL
jgi:hypothetical protein